jgi:hypothetical protein
MDECHIIEVVGIGLKVDAIKEIARSTCSSHPGRKNFNSILERIVCSSLPTE